jgi:hypothetical protein
MPLNRFDGLDAIRLFVTRGFSAIPARENGSRVAPSTLIAIVRAFSCFKQLAMIQEQLKNFAAAGFPIEPYPVDWRMRGAEDMMRPLAVIVAQSCFRANSDAR